MFVRHLLLVSCLFASCATGPSLERGAPGPPVRERGGGFFSAELPTMGTTFSVVLRAEDAHAAREAVGAARAELLRLDALLSEWRADSPVSAVNRAAGREPVAVPGELLELVRRALLAAERSGGAFDPTWAAMRGLWKFGDAMDGSVPGDAELEAARRLVDWRKVRLDAEAGTILLEEEGMALGLGGIAKGYAVDRVAALLRGRGLADFVIKLGGDLYAAGRHGERPWRAGVRDPRAEGRIFAALELSDQAFSTSGDYERYFVKDGVRYHHLIDPYTGRPATASRSVTARCPDATTAEVVTKPVFILGPERGIPYAEAQGCDVLVVDAANRVHLSERLAAELEWTQPTP